MVKVFENLALSNFGNVVHCFAGIVPNSCILIGEASQHGWDDDFEVARKFGAEGDGGGGQAYEAPIASMRLVYGVGVLIAQLVKNGRDPGIVFCGDELTYDALEPGGGSACGKTRRGRGVDGGQTLAHQLCVCRKACHSKHAGCWHPYLLAGYCREVRSGLDRSGQEGSRVFEGGWRLEVSWCIH